MKHTILLAWGKMDEGWFKLISDGNWDQARGVARAGGVVRNSYGAWIVDFAINLGNCSIASNAGIKVTMI